ncbi:unnamed protein product [Closterium sp. Naga37s-1]|nr:unnamed protein product [Closterium sp. Naga37s-1]
MAPSVRLLPNVVEIQETLHALLYRSYGLRLEHFIVEDGHTRMACWVPASHGKPAYDDGDDHNDAGDDGDSVASPATASERRSSGRKPPLLLIHGFGASSLNHWIKQIPVLSRHFELYIPSLVYFFSSTSASAKRRGEFFQAEAMLGLMDALGIERCQVVGLSYGGIVAYRMATLSPSRVARLAVAGSGVMMNRAEYDALIARWGVDSTVPLFLPRTPAELLRLIGMAHRETPYLPEWILQDAVDRFFENREEKAQLLEDLCEQRVHGDAHYPVPTMETLIVWGEDDAVFPISIGYRMHNTCPTLRFHPPTIPIRPTPLPSHFPSLAPCARPAPCARCCFPFHRHFGPCSRLEVFEKGSHALQADDTARFNHTILTFLLHGNSPTHARSSSPPAAAAVDAAPAAISPGLLSAGVVAVAAGAAALAAGAVAAISAATVVQ